MRWLPGGIAFLAVLVLVPAAGAAQRYASPVGVGPPPCEQKAPCSLAFAVGKASDNDEVIVLPGQYAAAKTVAPAELVQGVYIHGEFGAPAPVLSMQGAGFGVADYGGRVAHLTIVGNEPEAVGVYCANGVVEDVQVTIDGLASSAARADPGCLIRDSLLTAEGENAVALTAKSYEDDVKTTARNITAIAKGPGSRGVFAYTAPSGEMFDAFIVDLRNSIFDGQIDIDANFGASGGTIVSVSNSNFDLAKESGGKLILGSGNQTAAPLYVNAGVGDYREAAGSPTIDAGVADQLGATDLAGNPRLLGPAPDIGAYEFVPPNGQIQSLKLSPDRFKATNFGDAVISAKKGKRPPVTTTVRYALSAAGPVEFTVARKGNGRKVGKACKPKTQANKGHKKCTLYKPVKGAFSASGAAGANSFKFSGRVGGKALKPGAYRLTGSAGGASRSAGFEVAK